jgi:alpha-galactosidase/6-phospho-beta-glucosidase family protein
VFIDVGNVPNIGQVANLPPNTVVETAVRVDRNGFAPICFGALPTPVLGFVEPYAHVFNTTVDACFRKDKKLAMQALRMDPLCSHLAGDQVIELGERLLAAHKAFIPELT